MALNKICKDKVNMYDYFTEKYTFQQFTNGLLEFCHVEHDKVHLIFQKKLSLVNSETIELLFAHKLY